MPHHLRDVAGISVASFLGVISPHFSILTIPSRSKTMPRSDFLSALQSLYDADQEDDGIIFTK
jgi:hypothetical protein